MFARIHSCWDRNWHGSENGRWALPQHRCMLFRIKNWDLVSERPNWGISRLPDSTMKNRQNRISIRRRFTAFFRRNGTNRTIRIRFLPALSIPATWMSIRQDTENRSSADMRGSTAGQSELLRTSVRSPKRQKERCRSGG